ncbi:MAG: transposase [Kiritimatiellae bacterium]|nr:transposase [Kiritimatiellia bacterium]
MARPLRIKKNSDAHYHLMSRTNNKRFLFRDGVMKTELVSALHRAAEFCGVYVKAYTAMDNHFHVVVKVTKPEKPVSTAELLRRVGVLKGERAMHSLKEHWDDLLSSGFEATLESEQERLRVRMHDISEFIKLFKEVFDRIYKREHDYCGSIWSGRFASTLVQDGEHLERCIRYVIYNPIRAGIVMQAKDYCWSWRADEMNDSDDKAPDDWCLKRVVQIGAGKVFGDKCFVIAAAFALGDRFKAGSVGAHRVEELGWSTHGWRLAEAKRRKRCRNGRQGV